MRTIGVLLVLLLTTSFGYTQSKKELKEKVDQLTADKQSIMSELISVKTQMFDLKQELAELKNENEKLRSQIITQQNENTSNESQVKTNNQDTKKGTTTVAGGRCQAITAKGTQCSRNADPGSNYCWQHKSTYEPNKRPQKVTTTTPSSSGSTSGRTIYTGPRGGRYYINSHGNKTYIKK
jgi:colicin import membrane protein